MTSLLCTSASKNIQVGGSKVRCATSIPGSRDLVAATTSNELVYGENTRVTLEAPVKALASVRYVSYTQEALPSEHAVVLVLSDVPSPGLSLYLLPKLRKLNGKLAEQLAEITKKAHIFSVDSLGSDLVGESFRVAIACSATVSLLDVNPAREKVTVLGEHTLAEMVVGVTFSEMTIVASTTKIHHMLRISRSGGLAIAATVDRFDDHKKPQGTSAVGAAVGDGGAAVLNFLGGWFARRDAADANPVLAFALPDNRWLLVVDHELVTFSSFGAKLEEMENVFKSKVGMEFLDSGSINLSPVKDRAGHRGSASSFASIATGVSHKTFMDEALAARSEKPPAQTVFSSPFVMSATSKNEVMVYAANGSVPGVLEKLQLDEEGQKPEPGVKILTCRSGNCLASAYWPSGRVVRIELTNDLDHLIEEKESNQELRLALALIPAEQTDRMITLRRQLAFEARGQDWHDAAIFHMQNVINLSVRGEGVDQLDLVAEAVDLRGPRDSSWQENAVIATIWADFLFKLRRRVMRPSTADVDVLETLCRADESATRIKALLSVRHAVPLHLGEDLITSRDCTLREEERVDALVALYTSLGEHGKALVLLENSDITNSFDGVVGYLTNTMRATDNEAVFFEHLKWLAQNSKEEPQGAQKLEKVVLGAVHDSKDSDAILGQVFKVLVEEADILIDTVMDDICPHPPPEEITKKGEEQDRPSDEVSGDVLASALLDGMAKADMLQKGELFRKMRQLFKERVLHRPDASYHSYTLLQALKKPEMKALGLHEELAFLLGRQGRHEAAADELAAENNLAPEEALTRLTLMLPTSEKSTAADLLIAAYLRVSAQRRAMRVEDAGTVLRCCGGTLEIEKVLSDARCSDDSFSLSKMRPFMRSALIAGGERVRLAEMLRALRKSEVRRLREEVLSRRRRFVVIGPDRACTLCTRRIGDAAFAVYPDGSVAHLACHIKQAKVS